MLNFLTSRDSVGLAVIAGLIWLVAHVNSAASVRGVHDSQAGALGSRWDDE